MERDALLERRRSRAEPSAVRTALPQHAESAVRTALPQHAEGFGPAVRSALSSVSGSDPIAASIDTEVRAATAILGNERELVGPAGRVAKAKLPNLERSDGGQPKSRPELEEQATLLENRLQRARVAHRLTRSVHTEAEHAAAAQLQPRLLLKPSPPSQRRRRPYMTGPAEDDENSLSI